MSCPLLAKAKQLVELSLICCIVNLLVQARRCLLVSRLGNSKAKASWWSAFQGFRQLLQVVQVAHIGCRRRRRKGRSRVFKCLEMAMDLLLGRLIHLHDKDFAALEHEGSLAREEKMYDGVENRTLRDVHGEVNQAIVVRGASLVSLWKDGRRAVGASGLVYAIGLDTQWLHCGHLRHQ